MMLMMLMLLLLTKNSKETACFILQFAEKMKKDEKMKKNEKDEKMKNKIQNDEKMLLPIPVHLIPSYEYAIDETDPGSPIAIHIVPFHATYLPFPKIVLPKLIQFIPSLEYPNVLT